MATKTASKSATARTAIKTRKVASKLLPIAVKKLTPIAKPMSEKPVIKKMDNQAPAKTKVTQAAKPVIKKTKKPKLVRDSFTMPKDEYVAFQKLKERAIANGTAVKKGELLRAGLLALTTMSDSVFLATLAAIPALKTGRPKGAKKSKE
jgi:hypothetical protein